MSVLLDALKKAAEEKRAKQNQTSQSEPVVSSQSSSPLTMPQEATVDQTSQPPEAVEFTLSLNDGSQLTDEVSTRPGTQAQVSPQDAIKPEAEQTETPIVISLSMEGNEPEILADKPIEPDTTPLAFEVKPLQTSTDASSAQPETTELDNAPKFALSSTDSEQLETIHPIAAEQPSKTESTQPQAFTLKLADPEPTDVGFKDPLDLLDQSDTPEQPVAVQNNQTKDVKKPRFDSELIAAEQTNKAMPFEQEELTADIAYQPPTEEPAANSRNDEPRRAKVDEQPIEPEIQPQTAAKEAEHALPQVDEKPESRVSAQPKSQPAQNADKPTLQKPEPKQVGKLFAPTVNTNLKAPRSNYFRKVFYGFVLLSVATIALSYYAMYTLEKLDQDYQQEVQTLAQKSQAQRITPSDNQLSLAAKASNAAQASQQPKPQSSQLPAEQKITEGDSKSFVHSGQGEQVNAPNETNSQMTDAIELASTEPPKQQLDVQQTPRSANQPTQPSVKKTKQANSEPKPEFKIQQTERESLTEQAYQAYQQGDIDLAETRYRQALEQDQADIDAALGLAAILGQKNQLAESLEWYQLVLKTDPGNQFAIENMAAVATQIDQSLIDERQLKNLLRRQADSPVLQMAMGHFYASQNDWFKAQPYYFESARLTPNNPNYRLNLAISLDHLGQYAEALEHYQQALMLSRGQDRDFDLAKVSQRIALLQDFVGGR